MVEVCAICDIAGCRHTKAQKMTDSERIERLEAAVSALAELLLDTNPHVAEHLADIIVVLNTHQEREA